MKSVYVWLLTEFVRMAMIMAEVWKVRMSEIENPLVFDVRMKSNECFVYAYVGFTLIAPFRCVRMKRYVRPFVSSPTSPLDIADNGCVHTDLIDVSFLFFFVALWDSHIDLLNLWMNRRFFVKKQYVKRIFLSAFTIRVDSKGCILTWHINSMFKE